MNGVGGRASTTYRATERVFDYEALEPVDGQGQGRAGRDLAAAAARARRFGTDVTRKHNDPARRPRARAAAPR